MRVVLAAILTLALGAAPPSAQDCVSCHEVKLDVYDKSIHGAMACTDCHATIKALPHADKVPKVKCGTCHEDAVKAYGTSVHGRLHKQGVPDAATCSSCHGAPHEMLSATDAVSKIAKKNLPDTCGACHSNPDFLARHKIPFAKPVEAYRLSVHGRAMANGNTKAASCSDCHGSHGIQSAKDGVSATEHVRVADTCGKCHGEVLAAYSQSVHGLAVKAGAKGAPDCTGCHGEHNILAPSESGSLVNPARVSAVTCGRCHGDERLAARYNLPADKLPTFQDSYHGLAARGGAQTVANCSSCHGVHGILASTDPRSSIHPDNLAQTCGKCHAGVTSKFAIGPVHVTAATASEHPVSRWIRLTYWVLIPATIGFMLLHNGLDFLYKLRRGRHHHGTGGKVPRMNRWFRIAHALVMVSFIALVVTGFALKYPEAQWVRTLGLNGTGWARGFVHRVAAVVISVATVFHLVHLAVRKRDRIILTELLPRWQDAKDIVNMFRFNLGLIPERPTFRMFTYGEKMEYWAYMWGTIVMAGTGLILWANNWALRTFPKWVTDAATVAHWYEAILATLSILIWHWYMVIFDPDVYPMDLAWLTGKTSADHVRETRPEYYAQIVGKELEHQAPDSEGGASAEKPEA